jgi:hypothetical protein
MNASNLRCVRVFNRRKSSAHNTSNYNSFTAYNNSNAMESSEKERLEVVDLVTPEVGILIFNY